MGICPDQGPGGVCASFYMASKGLCFEMWYDISHGVWDDQDRSCKSVGLQSWAQLMVVVMNLSHSPYQSDARYHALRESTEDWLQVAARCPLFQSFLPTLIEDYNLEDKQHDENIGDLVLYELRNDWNSRCKGTQVKTCRFGNWVDRGAEFDQGFTFALLSILVYGLSEKLFDTATLRAVLAPVRPSATEEQRPPTTSANDAIQKFRQANRSNVHLAAMLMSEPCCRSRLRLLYMLVSPIRKWYGAQSVRLRSTYEHKQWLMEQVDYAFSEPLRATWMQLSDGHKIKQVGFRLCLCAEDMQMEQDHPLVAQEDALARTYAFYILLLVATRARRTMYLWKGWTGQQARFCSSRSGVREEAAAALLKQREALRIATDQVHSFWVRLVRRYILNAMATQHLLAMIDAGSGTVIAEMQAAVSQRISGVGQSKVSEDAMNIGRRAEHSAANKLQGAPKTLWRAFIDHGLASEIYRYQQPDWKRCQPSGGAAAKVPDSLFRAQVRQSPDWIKGIVSSKPKPADWFTTNADGSCILYADLFVLEEALVSQRWSELARGRFLGILCQVGLAIQPPRSSQWFLCLGALCGEAVLAWPARAYHAHGKFVELQSDLDGKLEVFVVWCATSWTAVEYDVRSPWSQVLRGHLRPSDASRRPHMALDVDAAPAPLVEVAARLAFFQLSMTQLATVARHLGVKVCADDTLWARLRNMIAFVLPSATEEEIDLILSRRLSPPFDWDEFLLQESAEDFVDEKDLKSFRDQQENMKHQADDDDQRRKEWITWKTSRRARGPMQSAAIGTTITYDNVLGCAVPGEFKNVDLPQEEAQLYALAPIRLYRDAANCRWQAFYPSVGTRSRAFALYGSAQALKLVLRWSWSERLLRYGQTIDQCPVSGLFDERCAEEVASSSVAGAPAKAKAKSSPACAKARSSNATT